MVKKLLILFIFFSFITHTITEYDPMGNPILGRLTYGDLFGILSLLFGINLLAESLTFSLKINKIFLFFFILLLLFAIGLPFSLIPVQTIIELLVHLFLFLLGVLMFYVFKDSFFSSFIPTIMITSLIGAIFGFYGVLAQMFGLPTPFEMRTEGEAVAGFRNAGQAGAYFMVMITMLYPLLQSKLKYRLSNKYQKLLSISVIFSILFLFITGKIAGYIGFVIGISIYSIFFRNSKSIISISLMALVVFFLYSNLETINPILYKRLKYKIESRVVHKLDGTSQDNFFESNWGGAVEAFEDNPFVGTGLGAFDGSYRRYEVHSTYLKMIGETGIIGSIGYLLFISSFLLLLKKQKYFSSEIYDLIKKMRPFVVGCMVSWTYTYHVRKREFWILLVFLLIIHYVAKKEYLITKIKKI